MLILGIDPGYAIIGWGVIRYERGKFIPVDFGAITTPAGMPFNRRLEIIYDELTALLGRHTPDAVAVEKLYFQTNAKTVVYGDLTAGNYIFWVANLDGSIAAIFSFAV